MDLEYINNLKKIKKEKELILEKEREITKPIITDFSLLAKIRTIFLSSQKSKGCLSNNVFFLVVMALYSPSYYVGYKMENRLRRELLKISKYRYPNNISYVCRCAVDQYMIYKDLRAETSDIINQIISTLKNDGDI